MVNFELVAVELLARDVSVGAGVNVGGLLGRLSAVGGEAALSSGCREHFGDGLAGKRGTTCSTVCD